MYSSQSVEWQRFSRLSRLSQYAKSVTRSATDSGDWEGTAEKRQQIQSVTIPRFVYFRSSTVNAGIIIFQSYAASTWLPMQWKDRFQDHDLFFCENVYDVSVAWHSHLPNCLCILRTVRPSRKCPRSSSVAVCSLHQLDVSYHSSKTSIRLVIPSAKFCIWDMVEQSVICFVRQ